MANWDTLKTAVANIINANDNQEITGQLLQNVLNNIITNVGENATFAGIATLSTNPGAPDGPVFYLATTSGTYPNFNGIEVQDGEAAILLWNDGVWTKKTSGFATEEQFKIIATLSNSIANKPFIAYNEVVSIASDGSYGEYMPSSSYDTAWVYILAGTIKIEAENIKVTRYSFFKDFSTTKESYLGYNTSGKIIEGAKICLCTLPKSNNTSGYEQSIINQDGGSFANKKDTQQGLVRAARNCFIDKYHVVNSSTLDYVPSEGFHSIWVNVEPKTDLIKVNNAVTTRFNQFSTYEPTPESYLGNNYTGRIINDNVKLVVISLPIADNTDLSSVSVELLDRNNVIAASRCFIPIYRHMISLDGNAFSYQASDSYDCLWVHLLDNVNEIEIVGTDTSYKAYFKGSEMTQENYLGNNTTGKVPKGATFCIVNIKRKETYFNYDNVTVIQKQDFLQNKRFNDIFGSYVRNVPTGKNLINPNDLLPGYMYSSGQLVQSANGILSNKIYLEDGKYYTAQGIYYYGINNYIFIAYFDKNDNNIGRRTLTAYFEENDTTHTGSATFKHNSLGGSVAYVRIVLQANAGYPYNPNISQLEEGEVATEVVPYEGVERFVYEPKNEEENSTKKVIRILSIGNSYSQDSLAYVPYMLYNMGIDADVQIGILMMSSSTLDNHVDNYSNETAAYTFYLYNRGGVWQNLGSKTIQWALSNYKWDIVTLQQSSGSAFTWSTYQPYLNTLINQIYSGISYNIKFGWLLVQARPASSNSGANWSDEVITQHYENIAENARKVVEETLCDFVVPVGTAIQNARSVPEIKALGSYADNDLNTSGLGYLTPNDGVHLQEGLPCQIAAYSFILKILELYGFENVSIYGETTRATSEWASDKSIPSPHGEYIGISEEYCKIGQMCAIMAHKKPFEVTNIGDLVVE